VAEEYFCLLLQYSSPFIHSSTILARSRRTNDASNNRKDIQHKNGDHDHDDDRR